MQLRSLITVFFSLFILIASLQTFSSDDPPDMFVKTISEEILAIVKNHTPNDTLGLHAELESVVCDYIDITVMSRLALGKHWRAADSTQQAAFSNEFQHLLISVYGTMLRNFKDADMLYVSYTINEKRQTAVVKTTVSSSGSVPTKVHYSLKRGANDEWRIYDVKVMGVSIIITYRSAFSNKIRKNGLDALITQLRKKNTLQN